MPVPTKITASEVVDPDCLDSLAPLDTGLPHEICPRHATAEELALGQEPTLVIRLDEGSWPPASYALMTIEDPVRQVLGPALPAAELERYGRWIGQHRIDLLDAWQSGQWLDHLRFLDGFTLTILSEKETGLPHRIAVRVGSDGDNEPTLVIYLHRQAYSATSIVLLTLDEPVRQAFGPGLGDGYMTIYSDWIRLNREGLLAHWKGDASSLEMVEALRPLSPPSES